MANRQESFIKVLGFSIASRRKSLGMSQENLAEKVGITQQAMARMEQGKIAPKLARLPELAGALQCSVAELFTTKKEISSDAGSRLLAALERVPPAKREPFLTQVWLVVDLME